MISLCFLVYLYNMLCFSLHICLVWPRVLFTIPGSLAGVLPSDRVSIWSNHGLQYVILLCFINKFVLAFNFYTLCTGILAFICHLYCLSPYLYLATCMLVWRTGIPSTKTTVSVLQYCVLL